MRATSLIAVLFLGLAACAAAKAASEDPAHGLWLTENGKALVRIGPCGTRTCGHMVWLVNPADESGEPKRDSQGRPLCGLQLIGGLEPAGHGAWEDGWILDPRSGEEYSAMIRAVSESELDVRGYLGLELFGSTQTWTRANSDRGGCKAG